MILKPSPDTENDSLANFTEKTRKAPAIDWYRTPISREEFKSLHARSDFLGFFQTVGTLGILATTGAMAIYSLAHWRWEITLAIIFAHGMVTAFLINGVHELGHGTVFKTKWLNSFFCHIFAFLGWINHEMFQASHQRHHRYTLHPPDDLEVVLPVPLMIWHVFKTGIINPLAAWNTWKNTVRIARGKFSGAWEMTLYPKDKPESHRATMRWARILLLGHSAIVAISLGLGYWIVPVLVTLAPFYGGWLFFLCNNTQHIGLRDNVPDFRLCCRTFTLNSWVRFLYWQMNYHTEHHMYAAVPCYRLGRLHRLIQHDLPPTPHGLVAVWKDIGGILKKQHPDPTFQHQVVLPPDAAPARL
jgi:fatty acid desaturase